jgi:uncharacterized protein (TIGR02646 family)
VRKAIKLERPARIPAPLHTKAAEQARAAAEEWAQAQVRAVQSKTKLFQQVAFSPDSRLTRAPAVRDALLSAQYGKCAFCESPITPDRPADVEWFRPSSSAVDTSGYSSLPHYAWLTVEWRNLHVSCAACNRSKGRRFPVGGERCPVGTAWPDLVDTEHALVLDPFVDDPDPHLLFTDDGMVSTETDEGRATIDCFALNRSELVEARRAEVHRAVEAWEAGAVEDAVAPQHPYAGARSTGPATSTRSSTRASTWWSAGSRCAR